MTEKYLAECTLKYVLPLTFLRLDGIYITWVVYKNGENGVTVKKFLH